MVSDKIRVAARFLRIRAQEGRPLDADALTALIHHLDQAAHDATLFERHAVVRPLAPIPSTLREDALVGLVHAAAMQLPAPHSLGVLAALQRIVTKHPEATS